MTLAFFVLAHVSWKQTPIGTIAPSIGPIANKSKNNSKSTAALSKEEGTKSWRGAAKDEEGLGLVYLSCLVGNAMNSSSKRASLVYNGVCLFSFIFLFLFLLIQGVSEVIIYVFLPM